MAGPATRLHVYQMHWLDGLQVARDGLQPGWFRARVSFMRAWPQHLGVSSREGVGWTFRLRAVASMVGTNH
jgi:hypothetical protein